MLKLLKLCRLARFICILVVVAAALVGFKIGIWIGGLVYFATFMLSYGAMESIIVATLEFYDASIEQERDSQVGGSDVTQAGSGKTDDIQGGPR